MTVNPASTMNSITSTAMTFHSSFLYFSFTLSLYDIGEMVATY